MDEYRKNKRFNCLVPIEGKNGGFFSDAKTVDLSKGGIGFISQKEIPLNEEIAIEMDVIEDGNPVFVIGKVKWVEPVPGTNQYRVGLTFDSVLRGSKTRLDKYFNSLENDL